MKKPNKTEMKKRIEAGNSLFFLRYLIYEIGDQQITSEG